MKQQQEVSDNTGINLAFTISYKMYWINIIDNLCVIYVIYV